MSCGCSGSSSSNPIYGGPVVVPQCTPNRKQTNILRVYNNVIAATGPDSATIQVDANPLPVEYPLRLLDVNIPPLTMVGTSGTGLTVDLSQLNIQNAIISANLVWYSALNTPTAGYSVAHSIVGDLIDFTNVPTGAAFTGTVFAAYY